MAENNTLGLNIELPIYNADGTSFQGLVLHKSTSDSVVMSLSDKITGDVYYKDNKLSVTMQEYVELDGVKYVLVNPPTVVREGIVSDNAQLNGMTKYSFVFYHPMYQLGNLPFTDIAVTSDQNKYLSESKKFSWIGYPDDFIAKLNKNLVGTEWIVEKSSRFPQDLDNKLSEVLPFDENTIADALKVGYDTWGVPYIVAKIESTEGSYAQGKRFKVIFGFPSNEIYEDESHRQLDQPFVFQFGQGVGLKNNSRTPRNNKIITRIAGYGSENNIPYGYPQIPWYGDSRWDYTEYEGDTINYDAQGKVTNTPKDSAYPLYMGILGGAYVKLIKHPFTRTTLMPSVYSQTLFNKVSPYNSDGTDNENYNPNTTLIDYYDAIATQEYPYPNEIVASAPSYESHQFEDIKPELGTDIAIVDAWPINDSDLLPSASWDDSVDENGNYKQGYFKMKLPVLTFDIYACAAITQEMQINMRSGACLGCTFTVQVDWDNYKANFYDKDGNFAPTGSQRDYTRYPDSSQEQIEVILQKETATFGILMPNIYQHPVADDTFVVLGISLPSSYISNAETRLDAEMKSYMLENNVHYFDYPLKFDEAFLRNHTHILSQIRPNSVIRFKYGNDTLQLFVKQLTVKYGEKVLPQYDITLTDNVEVVLNQIGQVADDVEKLSALIAAVRQNFSRSVWAELAKKLSKTQDDTAQGFIRFLQGLQVGTNFVPDILGEGGIFRMRDDGKVELVTDILYARVKAYFDSVEIREYHHTGGNRIASVAGNKICRVEWYNADNEILEQTQENLESVAYFRCYFRASDGEDTVRNNWVVGDQAYCHITSITTSSDKPEEKGLNQKHLWRLVIGRNTEGTLTDDGEAYIDLSNRTTETISGTSYTGYQSGSDVPEAQDDTIQLGNVNDATRQGAIVEYVTGTDAPSYQIYQGINSFSLNGKNQIGLGYNTATGKAYLNVYGDAYIGDRNRTTYIEYKQNGTGNQPELNIKAKVQILPTGSTIDGQTIENYIKGHQNNYDDTEVKTAISGLNTAISDLQDQIDGAIETLYGDVAPTGDNDPYKDYSTADKEKHLGDMYYDSTTGYAYRYDKATTEGTTTYGWTLIRDTGITDAIARAAAALGLANTKAKIFTTANGVLPTPPYNLNDVWVNATGTWGTGKNAVTWDNEILKCVTARADGATASISDWVKASKYTDDSSLENFITATYDPAMGELQIQVDRKIETWFQTTDPSSSWNTAELKAAHVGDMWYNKTTHLLKRYTSTTTDGTTTYAWETVEDQKAIDAYDNAAHAQDTADGKRRVFTSQPAKTDAYDIGDLWVNATYPATGTKTYENDVLRCKTAKAAGADFSIDHWQLASKYTDNSALNDFVNGIYKDTIDVLRKQVDGKAETWYQATAPSNDWYDAEEGIDTRADHVGDLWYNTSTHTTWYYKQSGSGTEQDPYIYTWEQQDVPTAVFDKIDGKADIFVSKPSTYNINDMWIIESTLAATDMPTGCKVGDIVISSQKRTGTYNKADWSKKDRYTDDSALDSFKANNYVKALTNGTISSDITQAQNTASGAATAAANAQADADAANDKLDDWADDGKVSPTEKLALKNQKADIEKEYAQIIADAANYSGISTTDFTTAYNKAITALTYYSAATPEVIDIITDEETDSDTTPRYSRIAAYYAERQTILNAIATAAQRYATTQGDKYLSDTARTAIVGALGSATVVDGGLMLTSLIAMRKYKGTGAVTDVDNYDTWAGISGQYDATALGGGIAAWYGGGMVDKEVDTTATDYAKSLFRYDGSGYLANGNITWTASGQLTIKDIYTMISGESSFQTNVLNKITSLSNLFYTSSRSTTSGTQILINPQASFDHLEISHESTYSFDDTSVLNRSENDARYLLIDKFFSLFDIYNGTTNYTSTFKSSGLPTDTTNISIKAKFGFWSEGFISALGQGTSSGGGVDLNGALASINATTLGAPTEANVSLVYNGSTWVYGTTASEYTLPTASSTTKGGVKVGSTLGISSDVLNLASGVVTTGTYRSVTVDTYGRVTAGTNPTTLSGYGITDAKIDNGVITLGSNTITPLTSHQSLADIMGSTAKGSETQPIYWNGSAFANTTYTLGKSVPSTAVFTDTWRNIYVDGSSKIGTGTDSKGINFVAGSNVSLSYVAAGASEGQSGSGNYFNIKISSTWRGIQNNLTSTSTTDSLSAYQGKVLNEKFGNYLPLAGGTMTGVLTLLGGQYEDSYSGALNMNNSDIYGLNSIYTSDLADSSAEGIHFYRTATTVDTIWVANGVMYFAPNRTLGAAGTSYKIWHEGNDGASSGLDADLLDGTHKSGLLTAASSSASTPFSITVGGTTKTISTLYASRLATSRKLWGNDFDGSANVSGNIEMTSTDGTYIQIGAIRIVYDATNNALKVVKSDGTTAANFYATGAVSALGAGSSSGGGIDLNEPLTSINSANLGAPTAANVSLVYNGSSWVYGTTGISAATASALGGIKVGYTTSGKNYKVQLDSSNNAYVNVPWTDTTYDLSGYATQTWVSNTLSVYATQSWVSQQGFITSYTDTKNTAGSTDTSSKIFLIGATSQAANPQTYSHDTAYVGTDGCLYSGGSKVLTSHQSVTNAGATLAWGSAVKVATIGSTDINVKLPANPNSDSWRNIYLAGASKVGTGTGTKAMNFVAGSNVTIEYAAAGTSSGQSGSADYFNIKISATNTWTAWKGATSSAAGTAGYMPAPTAAQYQQFLRGDGTWVSLNNYSLPLAASGTRGGVKIGYTTDATNRNYAVQLSSEKMYVNVPWTDTTYTFTNKGATLAWSTTSTIATVGGVDIKVTMPANPNTDHYAWSDITGKPSSFTPASHTHSSLNGSDNRTTNNAPSWYMTNVGKASIYTEFCQTGGASSSTYENRTTFTPWGDSSGQRPVQLAFNNNGLFMRTSSSDSAWNSWNTILHSGNSSVSLSGSTLTVKINGTSQSLTNTNTTYSAGTGISLSGTTFSNSGVRATTINGNYLRVNTNGTNADLTIPYATSAGSAGSAPNLSSTATKTYTGVSYHAGSDGVQNGTTARDWAIPQEATADYSYKNVQILRLAWTGNTYSTDILTSPNAHGTTTGLFYRQLVNGTYATPTGSVHGGWRMILDKCNSSVSLSGSTLTVTIGGVTQSLTNTNTWRGIQDNLTSSTNTTESLSAKQGYLLANGSARDSTKLPLAGGTMTGTLIINKTNDAQGTANNSPALIIGGTATTAHIEIDNNEIMAKSNAATTTLLYINAEGGNTIINEYTGNVGIGTASPSYKLHVESSDDRVLFINGANDWTLISFHDASTYFGYHKGGNYIYSSRNFRVGGDIYATGGVTAASDARLKDVQGNVGLSVEQIANAPAVRFLWKADHEKGMQVGTLAQYWQGVMPEVVSDKSGDLSLQYGVAALVSAITTAKRVVDHEQRIKALEKECERLRTENEQLKLRIA